MRGNFTAKNPEDIVFEMRFTMKLSQWIELKEQLSQKWPSNDLSVLITDMVYEAQKNFFKNSANPEDFIGS